METSEQDQLLLIGKDIRWKAIEGKACRVTHFTPFATVDAGRIKGVSLNMPYAILTVEIPEVSNGFVARLPVINKVDFRNLWEVFHQRRVSAEEEVLVSYVPFFRNRLLRFIFSAGMPRFYIAVFPEGWLQKTLDPSYKKDDPLTWGKPIAEWRPPYHGRC